jgi:hypothetical protein
LKYADDQSVVAVAAVFRAIRDFGLDHSDFSSWGVVSAPRFLGRTAIAAGCNQFQRRGAATVSPLIVPYLSQHVISGTISLALGIHGPNLGSGGGQESLIDLFLTSLALASGQLLPGIWVVATQWQPEPEPNDDGKSAVQSVCQAAALAIMPAAAASRGMWLRFAARSVALTNERPPACEPPSLPSLVSFLNRVSESGRPDGWSYSCVGGTVELTTNRAGAIASVPPKISSELAA